MLYNLYKKYIKNAGKKEDFTTKKIVINTPFVQERSSTQRGDMFHTIDGPIQLIPADVADLNFFSKFPVALNYCLVCIAKFTSKLTLTAWKKRGSWQLEKFLSETHHLRKYLIKEGRGELRLQTNQEFTQTKIKEITKKYNVVHFNSRLNDDHAVRAEQNHETKKPAKKF